MGFSTDAIHAGQQPDPSTGAITVPIFQTSTYVQEELGKHKGYEYARTQNPTREALEKNVAVLEGGNRGIAFASGMAAIQSCLMLLSAGDHVIATSNMYGGTHRLFDRVFARLGLRFDYVDTSKLEDLQSAFSPETKMVFLETPTNPIMRITDIGAVSRFCHRHSCLVVADNTFMSPYLQRPLELGADVVVHSLTKFLNGHSDSVGGILVVKDEVIGTDLSFLQNAAGAILSPFDSWLVLRGIKTLVVRMRQHEENGKKIAEFLANDARVKRLYYPGLPDHPQHELAQKQMDGYGAMISFELESYDKARRALSSFRLWSLAESLGGVESLVCHPASMTHASVPPETRQALGITDQLIRLSVGIEDHTDLIADLDSALQP